MVDFTSPQRHRRPGRQCFSSRRPRRVWPIAWRSTPKRFPQGVGAQMPCSRGIFPWQQARRVGGVRRGQRVQQRRVQPSRHRPGGVLRTRINDAWRLTGPVGKPDEPFTEGDDAAVSLGADTNAAGSTRSVPCPSSAAGCDRRGFASAAAPLSRTRRLDRRPFTEVGLAQDHRASLGAGRGILFRTVVTSARSRRVDQAGDVDVVPVGIGRPCSDRTCRLCVRRRAPRRRGACGLSSIAAQVASTRRCDPVPASLAR